jgi:hypothetical protein
MTNLSILCEDMELDQQQDQQVTWCQILNTARASNHDTNTGSWEQDGLRKNSIEHSRVKTV